MTPWPGRCLEQLELRPQVERRGLARFLEGQVLLVGAVQVADGARQLVNGRVDALLHVGPVAGDDQLLLPHPRPPRTQPQRHREVHADRPVGELPGRSWTASSPLGISPLRPFQRYAPTALSFGSAWFSACNSRCRSASVTSFNSTMSGRRCSASRTSSSQSGFSRRAVGAERGRSAGRRPAAGRAGSARRLPASGRWPRRRPGSP